MLQVTSLQNGTKSLPKFASVSSWESFLAFVGSSGLMWTLWMSEMTPSKAPILKPFVLQIFWLKFGEWLQTFLRKPNLKSASIIISLSSSSVNWIPSLDMTILISEHETCPLPSLSKTRNAYELEVMNLLFEIGTVLSMESYSTGKESSVYHWRYDYFLQSILYFLNFLSLPATS